MQLLFQFRKNVWATSLSKSEGIVEILEAEGRVMKRRPLVRRSKDSGHVYCLVQKGTRDEIVKIGINTESPSDPLRIASIYESPNSRLVILESDSESAKNLFILDEEQRIIKLKESAKDFGEKSANDSKAKVISSVD